MPVFMHSQPDDFGEPTFYAIECVHTGASTRAAMFGYLVSLVFIFVQQPCSNRSRTEPNTSGTPSPKYAVLQVKCETVDGTSGKDPRPCAATVSSEASATRGTSPWATISSA